MATLIAVDGNSLNHGLQKLAQSLSNEDKYTRYRVDHEKLAQLLASPENLNKASLRFYTDDQKFDNENARPMGRITKYFSNKGYGFVSGTDGRSYFFHHNELLNKKALCEGNEDRYPHPSSPEFRERLLGKVVTFVEVTGEDNRFKAEELRIELGTKSLDRYYQLRREPFLQMLEESGYKLVKCRSSRHASKAKSVDGRIILDCLWELEAGDHLVLLSDDPVFIDLLEKMTETGVQVTLATFKASKADELCDAVKKLSGKLLLLEDHLNQIELQYEDVEEDAEVETQIAEEVN